MAAGLNKSLNGTSVAVPTPVTIEKPAPVPPTVSRKLGEAKLLVVDDNPRTRQVMRLVLGKAVCSVVAVSSGQEAIDAYDEEIDLVIMDYRMPEMNGVQALVEIRKRHPNARILVTSGDGLRTREEREIVARQGYGFLLKPLNLEDILGSIERALNENNNEGSII
jgi:two-component system chemotaxis response regulator CheY